MRGRPAGRPSKNGPSKTNGKTHFKFQFLTKLETGVKQALNTTRALEAAWEGRRKKRMRAGSNLRPPISKLSALPIELTRHLPMVTARGALFLAHGQKVYLLCKRLIVNLFKMW